jgi:hypothetical protein
MESARRCASTSHKHTALSSVPCRFVMPAVQSRLSAWQRVSVSFGRRRAGAPVCAVAALSGPACGRRRTQPASASRRRCPPAWPARTCASHDRRAIERLACTSGSSCEGQGPARSAGSAHSRTPPSCTRAQEPIRAAHRCAGRAHLCRSCHEVRPERREGKVRHALPASRGLPAASSRRSQPARAAAEGGRARTHTHNLERARRALHGGGRHVQRDEVRAFRGRRAEHMARDLDLRTRTRARPAESDPRLPRSARRDGTRLRTVRRRVGALWGVPQLLAVAARACVSSSSRRA